VRVLVSALAILLALSPAAPAQQNHSFRHPWLRRITLAAACGASFWDLQTTRQSVSHGAREANPLLADSQGRPRFGRIVGFKTGTCLASFVVEERLARHSPSDRFWIGLNCATAGAFVGLSIHNLRVPPPTSPPSQPR
jgi:hypothetical protein